VCRFGMLPFFMRRSDSMKTLHIKNMVCPRCIEAVEESLGKHQLSYDSVELGVVKLSEQAPEETLRQFGEEIRKRGFELIEAQTLPLRIKSEVLHHLKQIEEGGIKIRLSEHLSSTLFRNYSYMSEVFSRAEGKTIEQYFIELRVERAKELLEDEALSVMDVALMLGFSSSQHFSNQFRKMAGKSPTAWRREPGKRRALNEV